MPPQVLPIYRAIVNIFMHQQARLFLVGGTVRDIVRACKPQDIDIEVHGITEQQLEGILATVGKVTHQGKSFGVFRVQGLPIDWTLPRTDSSGRKPLVAIDPHMGIIAALKRRDLTMNAMAIDLETGLLIDPFGGFADLKNGVLTPANTATFIEDPLRFYRVMQYIGRYDMRPDHILNKLCATIDISSVSRERIHAEFDKLFLLSNAPSKGLRWLDSIGRLEDILPELACLKAVPQEKIWHPEGSVFEHTMQTCDAAAHRPVHDRKVLIYAALCHDLGKATTTVIKAGRWRSIGHDKAGVLPARRLCARLTGNKKQATIVTRLVRYHMMPAQYTAQKVGFCAYKTLAQLVSPDTNLFMLAQLAYADILGRNGRASRPLSGPVDTIDFFSAQAKRYGVLYHAEKPLVTGSDIVALGVQGKAVGDLLKKAYAYQLKKHDPYDYLSLRQDILCYIKRMVH